MSEAEGKTGAARKAANNFLLLCIQEWGQSDAQRASATASYLREAGFDIEESGYPVRGVMSSQKPIMGEDADSATTWLAGVLRGLERGKFETEVQQLVAALASPVSP